MKIEYIQLLILKGYNLTINYFFGNARQHLTL